MKSKRGLFFAKSSTQVFNRQDRLKPLECLTKLWSSDRHLATDTKASLLLLVFWSLTTNHQATNHLTQLPKNSILTKWTLAKGSRSAPRALQTTWSCIYYQLSKPVLRNTPRMVPLHNTPLYIAIAGMQCGCTVLTSSWRHSPRYILGAWTAVVDSKRTVTYQLKLNGSRNFTSRIFRTTLISEDFVQQRRSVVQTNEQRNTCHGSFLLKALPSI